MRQRMRAGKPAEITFTCDFHEVVTGDLRPGAPVLLRYDPYRIVPAGEPYRFGDPERTVTAHLQFRQEEAPIDVPLRSSAGVIPCPDIDLTGQGSMLSAQIDVPAQAERLSIWFSYASAAGSIRYDSDYGANYRFGFACQEIDVVGATVSRRPIEGTDRFQLTVSTRGAVEDVTVLFFLATDPGYAKHLAQLRRTGETAADGGSLWAVAVEVPHGAIVRFKVCYWIGGRRLTDDNTGAYYLAPEPEADRAPPPPPALLKAAAAWR